MLNYNADNKVIQVKKHGLEWYVVIFRGVKAAEFASVNMANTRLIQLTNAAKA